MAANYWSSTQRRFWTFTKQEIAEMRENLDQSDGNASQQYPLPETRLLNIYFHQRTSPFVSPSPFPHLNAIPQKSSNSANASPSDNKLSQPPKSTSSGTTSKCPSDAQTRTSSSPPPSTSPARWKSAPNTSAS
ncbi:MAG: hypothetical protein Q9157_009061 [Trypethelium eluteriae]